MSVIHSIKKRANISVNVERFQQPQSYDTVMIKIITNFLLLQSQLIYFMTIWQYKSGFN